MTKITVVHHSADYDGIFCREIAKKFLPDAELIGWDFSDPPLGATRLTTGDKVYVLDLPVDKVFAVGFGAFKSAKGMENVIWIDHHKSAIDSHPTSIAGYRIDGVAACRLAWQWFMHCALPDHDGHDLPSKQDFIDRKVHEPESVRLAGEYDIWDKRDPQVDTFQFALRATDLQPFHWRGLLNNAVEPTMQVQHSQLMTQTLMEAGRAAERYQRLMDAEIVKSRSFDLEWEGKRWLAMNAIRCNSLTFDAAATPEHDGLLGFYWNGKEWSVSLYHSPHHREHDLSLIAVKYGGGGHRGACGFRAAKLSFIP